MAKKKKTQNHAKLDSGIAAAVTAQAAQTAAKLSTEWENNLNDHPASQDPVPPPEPSPPSIHILDDEPLDTAQHHANHASSLASDTSPTVSAPYNIPPNMASDWTRAGLAGSPANNNNNLVNLMAESPPTQPSSYEDSSRIHHGWAAATPAATKAFVPAPPSPPNSVRRPLSFQMEPHYQPSETPPQTLTAAYRRGSVHSPLPQHRQTHSPRPHHAQPHFYGVTDLDMTITPQSGLKPGEKGYFLGLDKLSTGSGKHHKSDNVVLAGYQGGLEIFSMNKTGLLPIASLQGLKGGVHYAKILPWTCASDVDTHPHIAVVLHGPTIASEAIVPSSCASPRLSSGASPRSHFAQLDNQSVRGQPHGTFYQTSVHVYSLKTSKLVDVLLQGAPIPIDPSIPLTSAAFRPPPPSDALTVKADAGVISVCSGTTGECWIYLQLREQQDHHSFACTGKLWTCSQQSRRAEVAEEGDGTASLTPPPRQSVHTPIIALCERWIAYCPAPPSVQITSKAKVTVPTIGRAAGLNTVTPPPLPPMTSGVDLPISDSMVNKIMRETTQELISGAKWVGQQGMQAWHTYWNRSTSPSTPQSGRSPSSQSRLGARPPLTDASQFPPTHGSNNQPSAKEPGLISIVDVDSLAGAAYVHPLTTFAPPSGCSFLSFSPSSLSLFTASSKGDVQTVWDLKRIQYTKSSPLQLISTKNEATGPQVRQIAQFSRMTVARIVDVAWTEPWGERLAMVTERGTVHLLDMPFSAFMWPAPRRRTLAPDNVAETTESASSAVSRASGALGAAYSAARPFVSRSRRSSANIPAVTGSTIRDSAALGSRVIAAGISSSLGKTGTAINQLRNNGENRVSLPPSTVLPSSGCVVWVKGKRAPTLYAVGTGIVRSFPSKSKHASAQSRGWITKVNQYKDQTLPTLPDDTIAAAVRQTLEFGFQDENFDLAEQEFEGDNMKSRRPYVQVVQPTYSLGAAITQAEIESSAPYQPFHTDRRIALAEYQQDPSSQSQSTSIILTEMSFEGGQPAKKSKNRQRTAESAEKSPCIDTLAWAFGQTIPTNKLELGFAQIDTGDENLEDSRALPPSAMERIFHFGDEENIVVTTRRRRRLPQGETDEDGFFEDDCEVLDFADQRV